MGRQFIEPPTFDLDASYVGSASNIPLIFVLPGNQPLGPLSSFAKTKKKLDSLKKISLGQGTGPRAEKAIDDAKKNGHWVLLQNCHLVPSWMPILQKIVESFEGKPPNRQGSSLTQLKPSPNKGKRDSIISTSVSGKQSQIHPSFRLWLTTYSSDSFPQLVLQNGIKIVNQPPIGLKANLISSYTLSDSINDPIKFQLHPYPLFWKRLLFSLCTFHALIQQRVKYGSLGWNEIYQFTHSDLQISILQLYKQLQRMPQLEFEYIPWKALRYLTGQCNYGGRITDQHDRKLLNSLLKDMYSSSSLQRDAKIRGLEQFPFPGDQMGYVQTMDFICNKFPITQPAELFGFSQNADIAKDINQGKAMCETLFSLRQDINSSSLLNKQRQSKDQQKLEEYEQQQFDVEEDKEQRQPQLKESQGLLPIKELQQVKKLQAQKRKLLINSSSQNKQENNIEQLEQIRENDYTLKLVRDVEQKIKDSKFDLQTLIIAHPIQYEDSINTILHHQLERYNSLLKVIEDSIEKVQRVVMGQIMTSNEIEELTNELKSNKTPRLWLKRSYPSIKPLGSYISDLRQRLDMFKFWVEHGKPDTYWFSGFFFPQSFLTAILQGYSRSRKCPIDELEFGFDFEAMNDEIQNSSDYPREMYAKRRGRKVQGETKIFGLYLEGASWNEMFRQIEESAPEILYVRMPVIEITVSKIKKKNSLDIPREFGDNDDEIMPMSYDCPVYLTQERRKKIATYSYSQNHLINITVPAAKPGYHWLKRGVALVCQISD